MPIELALKIVSKIKANERFSVYVVIPMWPEGIPTSSSVQEILHFQVKTPDIYCQVFMYVCMCAYFQSSILIYDNCFYVLSSILTHDYGFLWLKTQTMEMMYLLIAKALEETGLDKVYHPTDYLSFFCLGNREEKEEDNPNNNEAPPSTHVDENTIQVNILLGVLTWFMLC